MELERHRHGRRHSIVFVGRTSDVLDRVRVSKQPLDARVEVIEEIIVNLESELPGRKSSSSTRALSLTRRILSLLRIRKRNIGHSARG